MPPTPIRSDIDPRRVIRLPRDWRGPVVRLVVDDERQPDTRGITPFPTIGPAIA